MRRVHIGLANAITAVRAVLTVVLAALVVRSFAHDVSVTLVVAVASVALTTDALDGLVARRTGTVSRFGARFDMETDAALLLVLSLYVARDLGLWVLAIGLARYVFLAAKVPLPWLRGQAPARPWCKVVAALQGIVLVVAASALLPGPVAVAAAPGGPGAAHRVVRPRGLGPVAGAAAAPAAAVGRPGSPGCSRASWSGPCSWRPTRSAALSPAAFARIPVEALVLVGLVLLLPARPGAWLATGAGLALGVLTLLKLLDLGVSVAFARRFDPLGDPVYVGAGVSFLRDALGTANAYTVSALAVAPDGRGAGPRPVRRPARDPARPRSPAGRRTRRPRARPRLARLRRRRCPRRARRARRRRDRRRPRVHPRHRGTRPPP